ncbi:MAG: HXXEE domain-containing protein [Gemmatimonadales bacterium]
MTRGWAIWLLPLVLALHNLEEGVFFRRYVPRVLGRLPAGARDWIGPVSLREMGVALTLATVIPLGFSLWAAARPASRTPLWLVLAMWATLLLNAAWHVAAALMLFGGYAPGVVTAVALNLPLSLLVLRRAVTKHWLSRPALRALVPAAVALHLVGAVGLMLLARAMSGSG